MPGNDSIELKAGNLLERDTTTVKDLFAAYGRVFYVHGLGIDQPLDIIRNGYTHSTDTTSDTTFNSWSGAFAVVPHTDWRGQMDLGTFPSGGIVGDGNSAGTYCRTPPGLVQACVIVDWPATTQGVFFDARLPYRPHSWFGSLSFNQTDGSGRQYKRNRYYDPNTGRFTQEDPLGLGGALNLYGFANGNPLAYSDPFELCPPEHPETIGDCPLYVGAFVQVGRMVPAINESTAIFGAVAMGPAVTVIAVDAGETALAGRAVVQVMARQATVDLVEPTEGQVGQVTRQLEQYGRRSVEKSIRTFGAPGRRTPSEGRRNPGAGRRSGSVEREIRNWRGLIEAGKRVLGEPR